MRRTVRRCLRSSGRNKQHLPRQFDLTRAAAATAVPTSECDRAVDKLEVMELRCLRTPETTGNQEIAPLPLSNVVCDRAPNAVPDARRRHRYRRPNAGSPMRAGSCSIMLCRSSSAA